MLFSKRKALAAEVAKKLVEMKIDRFPTSVFNVITALDSMGHLNESAQNPSIKPDNNTETK